LLLRHGKLQNINPVKVDKTTIINLEKGSCPQVLELKKPFLAMMIDKKGWMMLLIFHLMLL
jgi:hypothetical protein